MDANGFTLPAAAALVFLALLVGGMIGSWTGYHYGWRDRGRILGRQLCGGEARIGDLTFHVGGIENHSAA